MSNVLRNILDTFGEVKRIGANGEKLANETIEMLKHMDYLIQEFEVGMQDPDWLKNFEDYGEPGTLDWAEALYIELKETRVKLTALGL